jgi:hypothetical protein
MIVMWYKTLYTAVKLAYYSRVPVQKQPMQRNNISDGRLHAVEVPQRDHGLIPSMLDQVDPNIPQKKETVYICGLRRTTFFLTLTLVTVLVGAIVGGAVGGTIGVREGGNCKAVAENEFVISHS